MDWICSHSHLFDTSNTSHSLEDEDDIPEVGGWCGDGGNFCVKHSLMPFTEYSIVMPERDVWTLYENIRRYENIPARKHAGS